jgi:hypothetical protein
MKPALLLTFAETFWRVLYHDSHLLFALPAAVLAAVLDAMGLLGFAKPDQEVPVAPGRAARRRARRDKHDRPEAGPSRLRAALADLLSPVRLREDPRRQLLVVALAATAASLLFISSLNPVFPFYFVIAFVTAALLAGYAYGAMLRAAWLCLSAMLQKERVAGFAVALSVLVACAGAAELWSRSDVARRSEIPDALVGAVIPHEWREAPRMGYINAVLRAALWEDEGVLGTHYSSLTHYLWHESEVFQAPVHAARYVRAHTPPGASLFGDSETVPLVALMTERRVCMDEADTNAMRFESGITDARGFIERMEKAPPTVVLAGRDRGFVITSEFSDWLARQYDLVQTIDDPDHGEFDLYRRKGP